MLTEKDAKTLACPFMPRTPREKISGRCLAAGCMMWIGALRRTSDGLIIYHKPDYAPDFEKVGYCGLTGKIKP